MLLLILLATVGAALFYYCIVKPYHYWTERGMKQGNPKWIVGDNWSTLMGKQNMAEFGQMVYNQCPGVRYSGMYQFFAPTLVLKDPELIKRITVKDFDYFSDRNNFLPEDDGGSKGYLEIYLLKVSLFPKEVSSFFCSIIYDAIKIRKEKGIVRPDMIHLLLEARKGVHKEEENNSMIDTGFSTAQETNISKAKLPKEITDLDIAAQAMVFFFAGFDGVSGLMCFMAYELATHPEVQDRLRQEVKSTLKECDGKLTYEALLKMKYMDMVVSETLRKWPFGIILDRICMRPYTIEPVTPEEKPVHLDKGVLIWIPVFAMHRDPQHFPDPERFDPDRFSDENKGNIKPYTYFPFGLGPRNCIGSRFALMDAKTIFFYLLNAFELVPVGKSRIPLKLSRKHMNLVSEGGFWFGMRRIKS